MGDEPRTLDSGEIVTRRGGERYGLAYDSDLDDEDSDDDGSDDSDDSDDSDADDADD